MKNYLLPKKVVPGGDVLVSMFPGQLQSEPGVSRIYDDSFEGKSAYTAAQNQNSCFYDEGLEDFHGSRTRKMVSEALSRF